MKSTTKGLVAAGAAATAAALTLTAVYLFTPSPSMVGRLTTSRAVVDACHRQVLSELVAPATARFTDTQVGPDTDRTWTLGGYVDAQNVMGVYLRHTYTCSAFRSDQGTWLPTITVTN